MFTREFRVDVYGRGQQQSDSCFYMECCSSDATVLLLRDDTLAIFAASFWYCAEREIVTSPVECAYDGVVFVLDSITSYCVII